MMQIPHAIPAIWVYTTLASFNAPRAGGYGAFLSDEQQARLERIRQARLLFDGRHREYFLDEGRSQFDFPRVRAGGRTLQMYLTYNVLGLISLKGADLLFGQEPMLRADDPVQQDALARLVERSSLHGLLYGCAVDASYEAESFLEACVHGGEAYLRQVPADEIFPAGDLLPDGQFERYVRYRVTNVGTEQSPVFLLLEVTYLPGRIERRCYQLDEDGNRREVALENWVGASGRWDVGAYGPATSSRPDAPTSLRPLTLTGVPRNTITWVPNLLVRGQPVSDYDGAIELQDALNAKNSQVGRVLLKHSDPRMAFPEEAFDDKGNIRADHEVFAYSDPEKLPRYITWNAELAHAMADRAFVLNQLLVRTETSPVLLGLKEGAAPDAYKKVRLESFNSLTKAARKAAYWRAGVRRAVAVAQDLENTLPGVRYDRKPIGVQLRDGIPSDDTEQAQRLALLRSHGLISVERALEEQLQDPAAVQKEMGRLGQMKREDVMREDVTRDA
jgi:Phage portal protein, SPP1 Gp6-like